VTSWLLPRSTPHCLPEKKNPSTNPSIKTIVSDRQSLIVQVFLKNNINYIMGSHLTTQVKVL
jgi:hypothetical protein